MRKRYILTSLGLLAVTLPAAAREVHSGGVAYRINGDGTAAVVRNDAAPYDGDVTVAATVTDGDTECMVTAVDELAFYGCGSLVAVTLPPSVERIGSRAFGGCASLVAVEGGEGVSEMGEAVFRGCSSLEAFSFPEGMTYVPAETYDGCVSLREIELPASVEAVGDYAFSGCVLLERLDFPAGVTSLGERSFSGCRSLTAVEIPGSVSEIGAYAFEGCVSLSRLTLPDALETLGEGVMSNCGALEYAYIAGNVAEIGDMALMGCASLSKLSVGSSVTEIGSESFAGCTGLEDVYVDNTLPPVLHVSSFDVATETSAVLHVPVGTGALYAQSPQWERFRIIHETEEFPGAGVGSVCAPLGFSLEGLDLTFSCGGGRWQVFTASGAAVASGSGDCELKLPAAGLYVVRASGYGTLRIYASE